MAALVKRAEGMLADVVVVGSYKAAVQMVLIILVFTFLTINYS